MSISDRNIARKSDLLNNKNIAIGICGGVGAVEMVKIIRDLRRHGATITSFVTPSVQTFITNLSLEWASGSQVVCSGTADVRHLEHFDAVVVAPATLNTLGKCSSAICDNAVTLLVAGQLGRKSPLLFIPAMNGQLFYHPLYKEIKGRLLSWGASFLELPLEEDRLKMPPVDVVSEAVIDLFTHAS